MVRPVRADSDLARSRISRKVGIWNWPSNDLSRAALGCLARRVRSSARVKSVANQPVSFTPSTLRVVLRLANSGRADTSVVAVMLGSWRAINSPSLVTTKSGSMKSAPISTAFL